MEVNKEQYGYILSVPHDPLQTKKFALRYYSKKLAKFTLYSEALTELCKFFKNLDSLGDLSLHGLEKFLRESIFGFIRPFEVF